MELPEIEQILEDKYQAMKHAKGWGEEEDDYALFASPSNRRFACDCPKAHDNANIAQESEQNNKVENMLDLDTAGVCEECAMMCTELQ